MNLSYVGSGKQISCFVFLVSSLWAYLFLVCFLGRVCPTLVIFSLFPGYCEPAYVPDVG